MTEWAIDHIAPPPESPDAAGPPMPPPDTLYPPWEYANGVTPTPRNGRHPPAAGAVEPYEILTLDDLDNQPPQKWTIRRVLPAESLTVLYGPPGSLKSFVALDWSLSIAAGVAWQGHHCAAGNVLYIAAEGGPGMRKRAAAWRMRHKTADPSARFRIRPQRVKLNDAHSVERLRATLQQMADDMDEPPALVVVDTWSRNTPGVDENSVQDVGAVIDRVHDDVAKSFGCGTLVVHHSGLAGGRERGSSALPGAADARWETIRATPQALTLRNHKLKDLAEHDDVPLYAEVVKLPDRYASDDEPDPTSLALGKGVAMVDADDRCSTMHTRVLAALDGVGVISQSKLEQLLGGRASAARELAQEAARCGGCAVASWEASRNALRYCRSDQNEVPM